MKITIKIAEIYISLIFDNKKLRNIITSLYKDYLSDSINKTDIELILNYRNNWSSNKLEAELKEDLVYFKFIKVSGNYNFKEKKGVFDIEDSPIAFYSLFRMLFSYSIVFFDGLYLHSSAVFKDNYGIIASGVSGAGKSTFAMTMAKQDFKIIHDDLVLVRKVNGVFRIFSIPFINDPRFNFEINRSIPLTHLFFLGKSHENYIKSMTQKDIYKTMMRMVLSFTELPVDFHSKYLFLIDDLMNNIKISRLHYNPETINIMEFL